MARTFDALLGTKRAGGLVQELFHYLASEPASPGEGPSAPLRTPALREGRSSRAAGQEGS